MGVYDWIEVPCPKCGKTVDAQTKGGACDMQGYTLENAPADVMSDVNRHAPYTCECGTLFEVGEVDGKKAVVVVKPVERRLCRICGGTGRVNTPLGGGFTLDCKYCAISV